MCAARMSTPLGTLPVPKTSHWIVSTTIWLDKSKSKSLPLVLVCASGVRSGRAVAVARKLGFEKVHSLTGGLSAWRTANLPVEKA